MEGKQEFVQRAREFFLRSNMLNDKQKDIVLIKQRTKGAAAEKRIQQQAYNFHFASSSTSSVD